MTALLHALGLSSEEILNFYNTVTYIRGHNGWQIPFVVRAWRGQKPTHDVVNADTGEVIFKSQREDHAAQGHQAAKDGLKHLHHPDRGNLRPLLGL